MAFSSSVNIYCISSNENIFVVLVLFSYNNLASTLSVCRLRCSLSPFQTVIYRGSEMSAFIGSNFLALHVWAVRCRQAVSEELLIALSRARSAAKFH